MAGVLDSNQRKVALVVVLLVVAAGIAYWQWPRGPLPNQINFICAETGETFYLGRGDIRRIPEENPKTGSYTLLPCVKKEGVLQVDQHYYEAVVNLAERNKYVNPNTLVVESPGSDVQ